MKRDMVTVGKSTTTGVRVEVYQSQVDNELKIIEKDTKCNKLQQGGKENWWNSHNENDKHIVMVNI